MILVKLGTVAGWESRPPFWGSLGRWPRRRVRYRRVVSGRIAGAVVLVAAVVFAFTVTSGEADGTGPLLQPNGLGTVHFGALKPQAVSALSALLGAPTSRFVNSGCGPRYTEVAWEHLYVEFRLGRFSGYRYIEDGWPPSRFGEKPKPSALPRLATARGITLESTLGEVRAAYGTLHLIGTDRWQAPNGLIFYDNATRDPPPPSSKIIEVKIGTCGDF